MKSMLQGFGLRLAPSGEGNLKVKGTLAHPRTLLR